MSRINKMDRDQELRAAVFSVPSAECGAEDGAAHDAGRRKSTLSFTASSYQATPRSCACADAESLAEVVPLDEDEHQRPRAPNHRLKSASVVVIGAGGGGGKVSRRSM